MFMRSFKDEFKEKIEDIAASITTFGLVIIMVFYSTIVFLLKAISKFLGFVDKNLINNKYAKREN